MWETFKKKDKAVLLSIKPKYCKLIANGNKTVEVRKTRPKLETPFKVYVYCTKDKDMLWITNERERMFCGEKISDIINAQDVGGCYRANGKVIGEFVCDNIFPMWPGYTGNLGDDCLTFEEQETYLQDGGYGWHISNLTIYENPKDLSEFRMQDKCPYSSDEGCTYQYHCFRAGENHHKNGRCGSKVSNPPQSWCYVEAI